MGHFLFPESKKNVELHWPKNPPSYSGNMERYSTEMQKLVAELLEMISLSLGLSPGYCQKFFGANHFAALHINYYPPCHQPDLVLGKTAHSDIVYLTALLQSCDVPGLEVHRGGKWHLVHPVPGALVINIGDSLEVVSNSKYKSVLPRAIVNSSKERASVVTFFQPAPETVLKPAPELLSSASPAVFSEVVYGDYLARFFSKKQDGKGLLESLRLVA